MSMAEACSTQRDQRNWAGVDTEWKQVVDGERAIGAAGATLTGTQRRRSALQSHACSLGTYYWRQVVQVVAASRSQSVSAGKSRRLAISHITAHDV